MSEYISNPPRLEDVDPEFAAFILSVVNKENFLVKSFNVSVHRTIVAYTNGGGRITRADKYKEYNCGSGKKYKFCCG